MTEMSVCVVGWYLEKFDDFYQVMHRVNKKYPVHIVSHRDSPYLLTLDLPYTLRENTGLEWGAYNYFLQKVWDRKSHVLFSHDDVIFHPFIVEDKVYPPELIFDNIASMAADQAYIFSSRTEDVENYSRHGRMVFMSASFLAKAKEIGGFWFDAKNAGHTEGSTPSRREQMGCLGYNAGIISFHSLAANIGGRVHLRAYIPAIGLAVRGEATDGKVRYGKWLALSNEIKDKAKDKLHLGCGDNHFDGMINVDLYNPKADVKADVRELPFPDNSFDWIESHHLIEHLNKDDAEKALKEWLRVLRPGGHMFSSTPDIMSLMVGLKDAYEQPDLWDGFVRSVYGDEKEGMYHRHGYSRNSLERVLVKAGYIDVEVKSVIGYRPTPSLLGIGKKEYLQ